MNFQYHYCARSLKGSRETVIDGVATVGERVQTMEQYRQLKMLVCGDVMDPGATSIISLNLLGVSSDQEQMIEAFESKYRRSWDDPACDEMKTIWADAWGAAKLSS